MTTTVGYHASDEQRAVDVAGGTALRPRHPTGGRPRGRPRRGTAGSIGPIREDGPRMTPLNRIAWIVTVAACALLAVLLLVSGYQGYAAIALAVGAAAAINLR